MKRSMAIVPLLIFCVMPAFGSIPGLQTAYIRELTWFHSELLSSGLLRGQSGACDQRTVSMTADRVMNVTVAFGYMDVAPNPDYHVSRRDSLYGSGAVLDLDAAAALEQILMSTCPGPEANACGFSRRGGRLTKSLRDRFSGRRVTVSLRILSPALSGDDARNRGSLGARQTERSRSVQSAFLQALRSEDAVLYLGHARAGGGPDFFPPKLRSNGQVDYAHYLRAQEGIGSLLSGLRGGASVAHLGVLACRSEPLFGARLRGAFRGHLVTANQLFDFNDILPTGLASLEAILGQHCGEKFGSIVRRRSGARMLTVSGGR